MPVGWAWIASVPCHLADAAAATSSRFPRAATAPSSTSGATGSTGGLEYLRETAATHAEAEHALTLLLHHLDQNQRPKSSITVSQAIDQWMEVAYWRQLPATDSTKACQVGVAVRRPRLTIVYGIAVGEVATVVRMLGWSDGEPSSGSQAGPARCRSGSGDPDLSPRPGAGPGCLGDWGDRPAFGAGLGTTTRGCARVTSGWPSCTGGCVRTGWASRRRRPRSRNCSRT